MDILELPIDQYQRYRMAAQVVDALREGRETFSVLEVGGCPPMLPQFLRDDKVAMIDRVSCKCPAGSYVRADALALPFAENSFDIVISLDVLEHIPQGDRLDFLEGLKDIAAKYVIVGAPFDDGEGLIMGAEKMLFDFIYERHGYEHEFLAEHISHGLPDYNLKIKTMEDEDWETVTLPNGYFPRWVGMMFLDYMLGERGADVRAKIRRFYNLHFFALDNCEPAYRQFVIAAQKGFSEEQKQKLEALRSRPVPDVKPAMEYVRSLLELARIESQETLKAQIAGLKHDLAARDEEIKHLKQYVKELTEFVDKIKSFPPYRIYSRLFKQARAMDKS